MYQGFGHEHFWTAGTDQGEEGAFFWLSTGRPVTYTNWNAGEPVSKKKKYNWSVLATEHYLRSVTTAVVVVGRSRLIWNDVMCI